MSVKRPCIPSSGLVYLVLSMPPPVHVGKRPPRASTRHSFVIGGTQAAYFVGPPGLERYRTTSHAHLFSDATAEVDITAAPTHVCGRRILKAVHVFFCLMGHYAHNTGRR